MRNTWKTIPLCEALLAASDSYCLPAQKPRHVITAWADVGLPVTVMSLSPVEEADPDLAHDSTCMGDIMDSKTENGFFHEAQAVADSLPHTTRVMLAATRSALESGCAGAPLSGFQHAGYNYSGGFCTTFDGLGMAARRSA